MLSLGCASITGKPTEPVPTRPMDGAAAVAIAARHLPANRDAREVTAPIAPSSPAVSMPAAAVAGEDGGGAAALKKLMSLEGTWDAPLPSGGVMTDVFRPIAKGTALLEEEWSKGIQTTATVFYLVGGELRADHFCDLQNQPRYIAQPYSDTTRLAFELRDITGLREHPLHFESVTFTFIDTDHHTQFWPEVENGVVAKVYDLKFTRRRGR
jgi:hypothetical protein